MAILAVMAVVVVTGDGDTSSVKCDIDVGCWSGSSMMVVICGDNMVVSAADSFPSGWCLVVKTTT